MPDRKVGDGLAPLSTQATSVAAPYAATAVPTLSLPAASVPRSCTFTQSQVAPWHLVSQPLVVSHTLLPAATQWLTLPVSAPNCAMNRADGSQCSSSVQSQPHSGLIVVNVCPPSVVLYMARLVYSPTDRFALAGSTSTM